MFIIHAYDYELPLIQPNISAITDPMITFIFYILSDDSLSIQQPTFVKSDNSSRNVIRKNPFYPINLLRDIAIEFIQTTHYIFIDCDILISSRYTHYS